MLMVHNHRNINDGKKEIKIPLFKNPKGIIEGMNPCLRSMATTRNLLEELNTRPSLLVVPFKKNAQLTSR